METIFCGADSQLFVPENLFPDSIAEHFIQQNQRSDSVQVLILLLMCRKHFMVRISDNGRSWILILNLNLV